jgi:hypothetical protein
MKSSRSSSQLQYPDIHTALPAGFSLGGNSSIASGGSLAIVTAAFALSSTGSANAS